MVLLKKVLHIDNCGNKLKEQNKKCVQFGANWLKVPYFSKQNNVSFPKMVAVKAINN